MDHARIDKIKKYTRDAKATARQLGARDVLDLASDIDWLVSEVERLHDALNYADDMLRGEDIILARVMEALEFGDVPAEKKIGRVPDIGQVPPSMALVIFALENVTEDEAYRQGWWAYSFGLTGLRNPYARNTDPWRWWRDGFEAAPHDCE